MADNPYNEPFVPDRKDLKIYDSDGWNAALIKARKDLKFAKVWILSWIAGIIVSVILTGAWLIPAFCIAALIAGLVGIRKDGNTVKKLEKLGAERGWSQ